MTIPNIGTFDHGTCGFREVRVVGFWIFIHKTYLGLGHLHGAVQAARVGNACGTWWKKSKKGFNLILRNVSLQEESINKNYSIGFLVQPGTTKNSDLVVTRLLIFFFDIRFVTVALGAERCGDISGYGGSTRGRKVLHNSLGGRWGLWGCRPGTMGFILLFFLGREWWWWTAVYIYMYMYMYTIYTYICIYIYYIYLDFLSI